MNQALKRFLSRVMAKKLYTGHPCHCSQFFEKRSVSFALCSTFNVSVYVPYYATWFVHHNEFAGKDGYRESFTTAVQVLRRRYQATRWGVFWVTELSKIIHTGKLRVIITRGSCSWTCSSQVEEIAIRGSRFSLSLYCLAWTTIVESCGGVLEKRGFQLAVKVCYLRVHALF